MKAKLCIDAIELLASPDGTPDDPEPLYILPIGIGEWAGPDAENSGPGRGRDVLALPERVLWPARGLHGGVRPAAGPVKEFIQDLSLPTSFDAVTEHRFLIECLVCIQTERWFAAQLEVSRMLVGGGFDALMQEGFAAFDAVVDQAVTAILGTGDRLVGGFRARARHALPEPGSGPAILSEIHWQALRGSALVGGDPALGSGNALRDLPLPARSAARFRIEGQRPHCDIVASIEVGG